MESTPEETTLPSTSNDVVSEIKPAITNGNVEPRKPKVKVCLSLAFLWNVLSNVKFLYQKMTSMVSKNKRRAGLHYVFQLQ